MADQPVLGTLYGVGVGPGDPELITLKAKRLIESAKVIAYPAPDTGPSFAREIVAGIVPASAREYAITIPMQTNRFPIKSIYDEAAGELGEVLDAGTDVVVLCEGDPFFYGSFMYLHSRLATRYPCEIVPGVSSVMTGGAVSAQPLASLKESFAVAPGPLSSDKLTELLQLHDNLVFIKVGRHLPKVRAVIEACGMRDHAVYMERLGTDAQRCMPLAALGDKAAPYFSLIQVNKRRSEPV
ncbi:MAG: precorrin-2 C(20)-methyltransferase [Pseudomonadota bacterium]